MKRTSMALFCALVFAGSLSTVSAQISTRQQQEEQDAIDAKTPKLNYKEEVLQLLVPGFTMGETVGVDVNSQNHVFVYSRTNPQGIARGGTAAMLWESDQNGSFVKEWGPHNYAASFAHSVRVDKRDNVWQVDEGSGMIVKYSPQAVPLKQFGRTPEAIDYLESAVEKQGRGYRARRAGSKTPWTCSTGCIPTEASAPSTAPLTSPGIHTTTCSSPTATGIRASSNRARWPLAEVGRHMGNRAEPVQHRAQYRGGRAGQRLRRRPQQSPHPGLRR